MFGGLDVKRKKTLGDHEHKFLKYIDWFLHDKV